MSKGKNTITRECTIRWSVGGPACRSNYYWEWASGYTHGSIWSV